MEPPSAQVGTKIPRSPSQALTQKRPQSASVDVTDLSRDGVNVEAAAVKERLRTFDPQVLEVGDGLRNLEESKDG